MNIFCKYTNQTLKKNKTRTLVTIIGIILSVAMFTATSEALASAQNYLLSYTEKTEGSFHAKYTTLDIDQYTSLKNNHQVKEIGSFQEIGFAKLGPKENGSYENYEYLRVGGIDEPYPELTALELAGGRLAQNENEIVVSLDYFTEYYPDQSPEDFDYSKNAMLTLKLGQRLSSEGKRLYSEAYEDTEKLTDTYEKTYTLVGVSYPQNANDEISLKACQAYTVQDKSSNLPHTAYFKLNRISKVNSFASDNSSLYPKESCKINSRVLAYSGIIKDPGLAFMFYGFAAVLFALIMFGSISLIYNSFSISVSERTKQFGLLSSIGATKKQIMNTVRYEALVLCLIAVPVGLISGCLGIGVTFRFLGDSFNRIFSKEMVAQGVVMKLHLEPAALIAAVIISALTTLISAYIPAKRAIRISAIDAIRQSSDITATKARTVKTSRLTLKLFGFEGMLARKNFKRSKKRYRTTVVSLFMSIVLFVSATSLCHYFTEGFQAEKELNTYDIYLTFPDIDKNKGKTKQLKNELDKIDEITEYAEALLLDNAVMTSTENLSKQYISYMSAADESNTVIDTMIVMIQDEAFDKYLKENGVDPQKLDKNGSVPPAIVYDKFRASDYEESGKKINRLFNEFSFTKTPVQLDLKTVNDSDDNSYFTGETKIENGETYYKYQNWNGDDGQTGFEWVPESKAARVQSVNVVLRAEDKPYFMGFNQCAIMVPQSAMKSLVKAIDGRVNGTFFFFKTTDHTVACEKISDIADDLFEYAHTSDYMEEQASILALITIIRVFSYGFITLISLIALANVFNTISTNVLLRRREMAMLKSVGMTQKGFRRMMNYESLLYGIKSLILGLPVSVLASFGMFYITHKSGNIDVSFTLPISSMLIATVSVFIIVFASMIYSMRKINNESTIDALKNENI